MCESDETDLVTSSSVQVQCENIFDSPTTDPFSDVLVANKPESADTDYFKDLEAASQGLATSWPLPNASMPGPPESWMFSNSPFVALQHQILLKNRFLELRIQRVSANSGGK